MSPPNDLDGLSLAELKDLVLKLLAEVSELRRTVAAQRDEIARLKGGPGRPNIKPNKPSGMERGTEPKPPKGKKPRRGSTRSKVTINEEQIAKVAAPPSGSRFKGYTSYVVQDLVIRPHVVNFHCERWQAPDGEVITAPLPAGVDGHFGPELRRFVLVQYHETQTTIPRLVTLLRSLGIVISKRQLVRLLTEDQDGFVNEARDVLHAGLSSASWITVDDTGARHKATNGFCTQIGNDDFAWFGTTGSKSRLNFLELLRAGYNDYVINDEALAYMRERALARHVIDRLAEHPDKQFSDLKGLERAPRRARDRGAESQPGPRADRHRRRTVGQRQGARLAPQYRHCQRRRRPVQCRRTRPVLGACRAPGSQARHLHRGAPHRSGRRPQADLGILR
jgi:hypothetical protein